MEVASRLPQIPSRSRKPETGGTTGIGAVGEDDVVGRVTHAVDLDGARPGQPPGPSQQVDVVIGQPSLLARVRVVRDHEVAPGEDGFGVHVSG